MDVTVKATYHKMYKLYEKIGDNANNIGEETTQALPFIMREQLVHCT